MSIIPTEVINDIRSRARIEDVISQFINVERKGNSYVAICPFHDDSSPSLHISVDKQIFKCFACPSEEGSAGDVFRFVEKFKHCSYPEAIRIVADIVGYQYDFGIQKETKVFEETVTHKINYDVVAFCRNALNSQVGLAHKQYLLNRKIDESIIEKFDIGYNPNGDGLYSFLNRKGYKDNDLINANVVRLTNSGIRDVFFDRIMIPICDSEGHPIGFTARSINKNTESKYINSTDTPVFNKSRVLYNLHRAKAIAKEKKYLIIAEGPMDVIAFDRAGLSNAVCSLGTAVTKDQLQLLKRYTGTLLLAFDGDKAGQGAILRTGKLAIELGLKVNVINNRTDKDPDEIINEFGPEQLINMVEKPKNWIEFILEHYQKIYDISNYDQKKEYAKKVLEEIVKLTDSFDRSNYFNQLCNITGFAADVLNQLAGNSFSINNQNQSRGNHQTIVRKPKGEVVTLSGIKLAQKEILNQMIKSKNATNIYKEKLGKLPDETMNDLANQLISYYSGNDTMNVANLVGSIFSPSTISLVYEIVESEILCQKVNEDILNDAIIEIHISELEKEKKEKTLMRKKLTDPHVIARICGEEAEFDK